MAAVDLADIRKLSVAERVQLAEAIWVSFEGDATEDGLFPLTAAQRSLLEERAAEARAHPGVGKSWEQVRQRILSAK